MRNTRQRGGGGGGSFMKSSIKPEIYRAIRNNDFDGFTRALEDEEVSLSDQVSPQGNTVLHVASSLGRRDRIVKSILARCLHLVSAENHSGDLALHLAAAAGHLSTVRVLLDFHRTYEVTVESPTSDKLYPEAVMRGNKENNTALHLAMKHKHDAVAVSLIERSPEASVSLNSEGVCPLHMAAEAGHLDLVKLMTEKTSLNFHVSTLKRKSLVHAAIRGRNKDVLEAIVRYQSSSAESTPPHVEGTRFHSTPSMGAENTTWVFPFLSDEKRTPLSFAASIGYFDGVDYFLKNHSDSPYTGDLDGSFPIHQASMNGHVNIVSEFLQRFPDSIELLNGYGQNILHVAAENGKAKAVSFMLKAPGLDWLINQQDKKGDTPLLLAAKGGHARVVGILACETERVNLGFRNNQGLTALDALEKHALERLPSLGERLSWMALKYADKPQAQIWKSGEGEKARALGMGDPSPRAKWQRAIEETKLRMNDEKESNITMLSEKKKEKARVLGINDEDEYSNASSENHPDDPKECSNRKPWEESFMQRIETLLLVATLVTSVTFAAGFTMPGGYDNSSAPNQGMAILANRRMFQAFLISNTIAMYSSIGVAILLIWTLLGDLSLALASLKIAVPLLGVALSMVSASFMTGAYLVVSHISWLATVILVIGSISLLAFLLLFIPFLLPSSSNSRITRKTLSLLLYLFIEVIETICDDHSQN